jgi:hypothetical protein
MSRQTGGRLCAFCAQNFWYQTANSGIVQRLVGSFSLYSVTCIASFVSTAQPVIVARQVIGICHQSRDLGAGHSTGWTCRHVATSLGNRSPIDMDSSWQFVAKQSAAPPYCSYRTRTAYNVDRDSDRTAFAHQRVYYYVYIYTKAR